MELNRRRFLRGAAAFGVISRAAGKDKETYQFRTADAEIEMTIEFHDGYASRGFWFGEQMSNRNFCLSAGGEEGRNCIAGFVVDGRNFDGVVRVHEDAAIRMELHAGALDSDGNISGIFSEGDLLRFRALLSHGAFSLQLG